MTLLGSLLSLGALAVNATLLLLVFRHRPRTEASRAFPPGALLPFVLPSPATHPFLRHRFAYVLLYGPSIAILSLEVGSDAVIRGAFPGPLGYDAGFGPGYLAAALVYGLLILAALAVLAGNYRRAHTGIDRKRARDPPLGLSLPRLA